MSPAPSSTRKSIQRRISTGTTEGAIQEGPRKLAKNPASSSIDSQPKAKKSWPTLTIDRYSAQSASHMDAESHSGPASDHPASATTDSPAPASATAVAKR